MHPNAVLLGSDEIFDLLDHAPVGVLVEDCTGRVVWMNHTMQWQLGVEARDCIGRPVSGLPFEPLPGARGMRMFRTVETSGSGPNRRLKCIEDVLPEQSQLGIRARYFIETYMEKDQAGINTDLLRLLINRPSYDRTTGVRDRHGIRQLLQTEVARSRRYGNPLSVVLARIIPCAQSGQVVDHPSRLMATASGLLRESTRWADSVGRESDWEFLLVLPETTAAAAIQLARKIESRLERPASSGSPVGPFSIVFGVAEWRRGDDEVTLCQRAREQVSKDLGSGATRGEF